MTGAPILAVVPKSQRLASWIDSYVELTSNIGAPELFRRWSAIACVAGVMERKIWVNTSRGPTFPNMYTVLVGAPGVGKGISLNALEIFWRELGKEKKLHVSPTSITKASLIDSLREAVRKIVNPTSQDNPYVEFNSLAVISKELGVLIPGYENELMNVLTDIYDNNYYSERRRTNALKFDIEKPQLNIIAATTPSYLQHLMPEGAWNQGFASRVMFVYSSQQAPTDFFRVNTHDEKLYKAMQGDLEFISGRFGEIKLTPEAQEAFIAWHMAGGPPTPDHPRLEHYLTRRSIHLLKTMMIVAVSRAHGPREFVTLEDYQQALNWFLEVEVSIPDIFRAMSAGGESQVQEELWHFAFRLWMKTKVPVPEHQLVAYLREKIPSHNIMKVIEIMVRSGIFEVKQNPATGLIGYQPAPRHAS